MSLPDSYDTTRHALHAVAEHVLAKARYLAVGRIGLVAAPGGFATPAFDGRVVRVDGADIVVADEAGERRAPLTTLRAAGELVGVTPGMLADVYRPATPLVPDAPLDVEPDAAAILAGWLALGDEALERFTSELRRDTREQPSDRTLWPEHFDLAVSSSEVNFGVSPGDDAITEPYAYVGPWAKPLPGDAEFWNEPFGAAVSRRDIGTVDDLVGFFRAGWVASRPS
jgi:hypothetical protein